MNRSYLTRISLLCCFLAGMGGCGIESRPRPEADATSGNERGELPSLYLVPGSLESIVFGAQGSFGPNTALTITLLASDESVLVQTQIDGSFNATLGPASFGDSVLIEDGADTTIQLDFPTPSVDTNQAAADPSFAEIDDVFVFEVVTTVEGVLVRAEAGKLPPEREIAVLNITQGFTVVDTVLSDGSLVTLLGGAPGDRLLFAFTDGSGSNAASVIGGTVVP